MSPQTKSCCSLTASSQGNSSHHSNFIQFLYCSLSQNQHFVLAYKSICSSCIKFCPQKTELGTICRYKSPSLLITCVACLSAGKKSDLLTAVVCLSVCCWMRDVCVCRARLFIRRFGLLPQKQLSSKHNWSSSSVSLGHGCYFSVALHQDCTPECVIVPLCTTAPLYVCLVMWREINDALESLV